MKKITKNIIKLSVIPLNFITPLLIFSHPTLAQSNSSFQSSCTNVSIAGDTLSANCRRRDGRFNRTAIRIRGIHNNNGNLVFTNLNTASSFQSSCTNISIAGNTLSANCRRRNGSFNHTSILVPGISNNNGNLTY